jgi:NADPH-dependent ferric siderophore reductase
VLLERLPADADVQVLVELASPDGRLQLSSRPPARFDWLDLPRSAAPGDALLAAVVAGPLPDDVRVWAAGEAAAMQRLRRHLFDERGVPRSHATVRGYWKHGRAADGED